jgi:hypothetical protein
MAKYALVSNNVAVNVVPGDPFLYFHPTIAKDLVPVPDEVEIGFVHDTTNDTWAAPVVVPPPEAPAP